MGLLRDQESELPMLRRLVARLTDSTRRRELDAEEWPTAMVAYSLQFSEDPQLLTEGLATYADFVQLIPAAERLCSLNRLASFVNRQKGAGWRAFLLYAMGETTRPELSAKAATLAITNAPSTENEPFSGAQTIARLLAREEAPAAMLSALLSLSDLRLLPTLQPLATLHEVRLTALLSGLNTTLNSLSSAYLLELLEARPQLAQPISDALAVLAKNTPLVADIAMPIPTWAYTKPTPQPLHAWSLPEYFPRILPRLLPHLSSQQIDTLREAFV